MALLSKSSIQKRLESGSLVIDPPPVEDDFDTDAVEVHLSGKIYTWKSLSGGGVITLPLWKRDGDKQFHYKTFARENLQEVKPDPDGIVTLRPGTFYLADLAQYVKLPDDIAMHVQGKSSLARLGLAVHVTAPHAHAGWSGRLTLEMFNYGPFNLELKPSIPIGQIYFWRVEDPVVRKDLQGHEFDAQEQATGANDYDNQS